MLKGIPSILSPELLKVLMEMGHGDEIVISDGNFPGASMAQRLIRADGHGCSELVDAILQLFPLDSVYSDKQVVLMEVVPGDPYVPEIWDEYAKIVEKHDPNAKFDHMERFAYYERAKKAYAVVQTGETAIYANIILKKGVVVPE
ncbi:MAG: L-fucose mutarotase [Clostridia bacterium]|nr:L-fucose mutarotase [Clostridia bacterium]